MWFGVRFGVAAAAAVAATVAAVAFWVWFVGFCVRVLVCPQVLYLNFCDFKVFYQANLFTIAPCLILHCGVVQLLYIQTFRLFFYLIVSAPYICSITFFEACCRLFSYQNILQDDY